jgi:hypothetical protein
MPRRQRASKRRTDLTSGQFWELTIGPFGSFIEGSPWPSHFRDEREREHAYWLHAEEIVTNPGTRSAGWWAYESGLGGSPEDPGAWLAERGHLGLQEEAHVLKSAALYRHTNTNPYEAAAGGIRRRRAERSRVGASSEPLSS